MLLGGSAVVKKWRLELNKVGIGDTWKIGRNIIQGLYSSEKQNIGYISYKIICSTLPNLFKVDIST